jgi:hypothetical protein
MVLSAGSALFSAFAALQISGWAVAIAGLRSRIPFLHRIAAPASALLVLNAAAVVGLYKFLFNRGPLWKIWNSTRPEAIGPTAETENLAPQEHVAAAAAMDIGRNSNYDSRQRKDMKLL